MTKYTKYGFYKSIYKIAEYAKNNGLVIYGAGFWGEMSYRIFSLFNIIPDYFCDDNKEKQNTFFCDGDITIPIVSLEEAAKKKPKAVYFSAVINVKGENSDRNIMNNRLKKYGLFSEYSGFHASRYMFLLEGGWQALEYPLSLEHRFKPEYIRNMVILSNMGNSGTSFFQPLVNGHPNIINIPFWSIDPKLYEERLQFLQGKELVLETVCLLQPVLASKYAERQIGISRFWEIFLINQEGEPEEKIFLDPARFVSALSELLKDKGTVSFAMLYKAIFAAYANAIDKEYIADEEYWIILDRHIPNYNICEMDKWFKTDDFDRLEYWFIIREPVQHWFSNLRVWGSISSESYNEVASLSLASWENTKPFLCSDLGKMLEIKDETKEKIVKILRFEDLKRKTKETIQLICDWIQIPFNDSMMQVSVNNIPVYAPASLNAKNKGVISGCDTTAVDRKDFSAYMSSFDIFRLNLVFQEFKHTYGYSCDVPHFSEFSQKFLKELYSYPFKFEELLDKRKKKAKELGLLSDGESLKSHEDIKNLFLQYMKENNHILYTDIFGPQ